MASHQVVYAPTARAQLVALNRYIARQASPDVALRFTDALKAFCDGYETFPNRGTRRGDLRPGLRTVGFRRRVTVAFMVEGDW